MIFSFLTGRISHLGNKLSNNLCILQENVEHLPIKMRVNSLMLFYAFYRKMLNMLNKANYWHKLIFELIKKWNLGFDWKVISWINWKVISWIIWKVTSLIILKKYYDLYIYCHILYVILKLENKIVIKTLHLEFGFEKSIG